MRRYLSSHFLALVVYLVVLVVFRGEWAFSFRFLVETLVLGLGLAVGVYMLFLDRVVYTFSYPKEQLSQYFVWYWKKKQYVSALALLDSRRSEQQKLTFRSALFMIIWVPLALFAVTSTPSLFGKGVVMGLMFHILYDAWRLQRMAPEKLNVRLFWQVKRQVGYEEQLVFLSVMTVIFALFSYWVS